MFYLLPNSLHYPRKGGGSRNFLTFSTFWDIRYSLSESGVPPNSAIFGGTVPPNSVLFGGTVPPNSFPQSGMEEVRKKLHLESGNT